MHFSTPPQFQSIIIIITIKHGIYLVESDLTDEP